MKFSDAGMHPFSMLGQQVATLRFRDDAAFPQGGVAQHLPDRHPRLFQPTEEFDPDKDGRVVVPLTGMVPVRVGEQPDPLVVADGVG